MADQDQANPPAGAPTAGAVNDPTPEQIKAAVQKVNAPKKNFTPTAETISHRTPEQFQAAVDSLEKRFNPSARPHPTRTAAIKAALTALAADFKDCDFIDAVHESGGTETGHQILIRVTGHKLD